MLHMTHRVELTFWGNVTLAVLVGVALLCCAISLWRSRSRKR